MSAAVDPPPRCALPTLAFDLITTSKMLKAYREHHVPAGSLSHSMLLNIEAKVSRSRVLTDHLVVCSAAALMAIDMSLDALARAPDVDDHTKTLLDAGRRALLGALLDCGVPRHELAGATNAHPH